MEKEGTVNITDLAPQALDVSEMTVRRDLMELEKMNLIQRFHGGAVISFGRSYEALLLSRQS